MTIRYEDSGSQDDPVEFGDRILYECVEGTWMEHDRDQPNYPLTCQNNGFYTLQDPHPFPNCTKSKSCFKLARCCRVRAPAVSMLTVPFPYLLPLQEGNYDALS